MNDDLVSKGWDSNERLPEGLASWLKDYVQEQERKQDKVFTQVSTELGVEASKLSRWVSGWGPMDRNDIKALAASLGPVVYTFLGEYRINNSDNEG
jgi:hypothetical protein